MNNEENILREKILTFIRLHHETIKDWITSHTNDRTILVSDIIKYYMGWYNNELNEKILIRILLGYAIDNFIKTLFQQFSNIYDSSLRILKCEFMNYIIMGAIDIIQYNDLTNEYTLIEVKSSNSVKFHHTLQAKIYHWIAKRQFKTNKIKTFVLVINRDDIIVKKIHYSNIDDNHITQLIRDYIIAHNEPNTHKKPKDL